MAPSAIIEPTTGAGDALLTDIVNDHEAPSYHVIERVRRGVLAIEAEAAAAERAAIRAAVEAIPILRPFWSSKDVRDAVLSILDAREPRP